jgi:hypothetical protein
MAIGAAYGALFARLVERTLFVFLVVSAECGNHVRYVV